MCNICCAQAGVRLKGVLRTLLLDSVYALALALRCLQRFRWSRACMACIYSIEVPDRAMKFKVYVIAASIWCSCLLSSSTSWIPAQIFNAFSRCCPGRLVRAGTTGRDRHCWWYQMITTLWVSFTVSVPSSLTTYDFPPPHPSPIRARQAHRPDSDAMGACGSSYCDVSSWFSCLPTVHGTSLLVWDGLQFS